MTLDPPLRAGRGSGFEAPAESAALARLAAVTAELAAAGTLDDIVTVVASHVRDAVHAAVSTLILREGDELVMAGQLGVADDKARRWARFGLCDDNPASEAVREGRPVIAATPDEVAVRYPAMAADTPPQRSVIDLPLNAAGGVLGAIGLTFEDNWVPGPLELDFLMTFADACAQAISRVVANDVAARSAARLTFLATASEELARTLDYNATLAEVARLAVPGLADWCAVDLLVDGTLTTLALTHADPARIRWAYELRERYPVDMSAERGAPRVLRTGQAELSRDITDEQLAASARDPHHLQLMRDLELRSALVAPLVGRAGPTGVISLLRAHPSPNFTADDLLLAEDLGRRAGIAIENARLYEDVLNVATELQRAVLPNSLAALPGWRTAAVYRPSGRTDVGGDFYDSVALPDGRLAVFVGDVMGHGIHAAAAMAQLRAAVRTLLTVDPEPTAVMRGLQRMFEQFDIESLVGLIYAVLDRTGHVRLANAGMCPPLVLTDDAVACFLPEAERPPLGASAGDPAMPPTETDLGRGATLLLYTDGLVERRGESIDTGLSRLAAHASSLADQDLDSWLGQLIDDTAAAVPQDDLATLAVRAPGATG